jgi:DNA primase
LLVPSKSSLEFLAQSTRHYQRAMRGSPAEEYLMQRGLTPDSIRSFRLGYVADSMPGHEKYVGRIAIPYLSPDAMPLQLRFRRVGDGDGPKFLSTPGDIPRPYNTKVLEEDHAVMFTVEGEPDTWVTTQCGLPAIGFPGVSSWKREWGLALRQYDTVYHLADADDKGQGQELGERIARDCGNVRIVLMPEGHDVNSLVLAEGPEALLRKVGME